MSDSELTDESIAKAVTDSQGNLSEAAMRLDISLEQLRSVLLYRSSRQPNAYKAAPLTMEQVTLADKQVNATGEPVIPDIKQQLLSDLGEKLDKSAAELQASDLRGSLQAALASSENDVDIAMSLQSFYGKHFGEAVNLVGGNMVVASVRLGRVLDKLQKRILDDNYDSGGSGEGEGGDKKENYSGNFRRMADLNSIIGVAGALTKMHDSTTAAALARAKILSMSNTKSNSTQTNSKAGWKPKSVTIDQ